MRATNPLYDQLLDYRYYRLRKTSQSRSSRDTGKAKEYVKRMEYILCMSEGQAFIALPKLLTGFAKDQYDAVRGSADSSEGGVSNWPEAVQYLLHSHAISAAINEAVSSLRDIKQGPAESERDLSSRLSKAFARCGNVHPLSEKVQYFIDALDRAIKSLVSRHRERYRKATFLEFVQFAEAEGDARSARQPTRNPIILQQGSTFKLKEGNFIVGDPSELDTGSTSTTKAGTGNDALHYICPDSSSIVPVLIPTTDLPSTTTGYPPNELTAESDPLFAIHGGHHRYGRAGYQQKISASAVPYQKHAPHMSGTRPGWVDRSQAPARNAVTPVHSVPAEWICHSCYGRAEHLAPQCTLSLKDIQKIVENYEDLSESERARVPDTSYSRIKNLVGGPTRQPSGQASAVWPKTSQVYGDFAPSR